MPELRLEYTSRFSRDVKQLQKRNLELSPLREVIKLIALNTAEAREELRRRHRMHQLKGAWRGAHECHIANSGDWLLVWQSVDGIAILLRTGTHEEIFK